MRLADLDAVDFRLLPIEALKALQGKLSAEFHRRGVERKQVESIPKLASSTRTWRVQIDSAGNRRKETVVLQSLLAEDWTALFQGSEERKFYVYAHVIPSSKRLVYDCSMQLEFKGVPFYIGKGTGSRAYDLKRNQGHGATLFDLSREGKMPEQIVTIIASGLTEPEALALESKLIYFFGTKYEKDRQGILVNLDIPRTPY